MPVDIQSLIRGHDFSETETDDLVSLLEHTGWRMTEKIRRMIRSITERRASRGEIMRVTVGDRP